MEVETEAKVDKSAEVKKEMNADVIGYRLFV